MASYVSCIDARNDVYGFYWYRALCCMLLLMLRFCFGVFLTLIQDSRRLYSKLFCAYKLNFEVIGGWFFA